MSALPVSDPKRSTEVREKTGSVEIDVAVSCESWRLEIPDVAEMCRDAALAALETVGPDLGGRDVEISLMLGDDALIRGLNREYRNQDKATNVLSFTSGDGGPESSTGPATLGDAVIAFETVKSGAHAQGKSLEAHLAHMVVHGVLHLLGFDHKDPSRAEQMEGLEISVLAGLGHDNPYADGAACNTPPQPRGQL